MKKLFLISLGFLFLFGLSSCKKDPLEHYFVKAEQNPDFFVMNLPVNSFKMDKENLDKKTLAEVESIKKINLLLYKPSEKSPEKLREYKKVENILHSSAYKKLFTVTNEGRKIEFVYQGQPKSINKITFLGRDSSGNFVLGFIKAKQLSTDALIKALKKIKQQDNSHLSQFLKELNKTNIK